MFSPFFIAQLLKKITTEETVEDKSTAELDALKHRDWVRRRDREDNTNSVSDRKRCGV